ncbi:MAG: hypothetical protein DWQ37_22420 [Planctomycetota bacterium]|nr:MAG: hypothetical protein DWQ37_22420 [Planctomycetota bacterium]
MNFSRETCRTSPAVDPRDSAHLCAADAAADPCGPELPDALLWEADELDDESLPEPGDFWLEPEDDE